MKKITKSLRNLQRFIQRDIPEIVGSEAVNHFRDSFHNQGFTDNNTKKWKDVKRRNPTSPWFGFKYRSRVRKPASHPSRKGSKRPYKPRKDNPITNYSPAATKSPVLTGSSGDLHDSITYKVRGNKVIISSDKPYAKIHNQGGKIKIFGKKSTTVPARPFIGKSRKLQKTIIKKIQHKAQKIIENSDLRH